MKVLFLKTLYKTSFFILFLLSLSISKNITNSINFTIGIPELFDIKYGLKVSRVSFYIRPGIGWYVFYKVNNKNDWEIFPELSISYRLFKKGNWGIGPEVGFSYIYHDGYYNSISSSNYYEKYQTDKMFENIKANVSWNSDKSMLIMTGNVGFSITEDIYRSQIIQNNSDKHKTEIDKIGIFPIISFEIGRKF